MAGRGTEAQSPEMGEGWPYWSSRWGCRYLQLIPRWSGGCWLVGVVLGDISSPSEESEYGRQEA